MLTIELAAMMIATIGMLIWYALNYNLNTLNLMNTRRQQVHTIFTWSLIMLPILVFAYLTIQPVTAILIAQLYYVVWERIQMYVSFGGALLPQWIM